jgi:hypothetical protein
MLTGLVLSLAGYGISAVLEPMCYPGGGTVFDHRRCPLPQAFDQEALYHVVQIAGYLCVGAAGLADLAG